MTQGFVLILGAMVSKKGYFLLIYFVRRVRYRFIGSRPPKQTHSVISWTTLSLLLNSFVLLFPLMD